MTDILQGIDQEIETLQKAKSILEAGDLNACISFYQEGFHKLKAFQGEPHHYGLTDEVNKLTLSHLQKMLERAGCTVTIDDDRELDEPVTFYVHCQGFSDKFGTIEMPEKTMYLSVEKVTVGLHGGKLRHVERILEILKRIEFCLNDYGFQFEFSRK